MSQITELRETYSLEDRYSNETFITFSSSSYETDSEIVGTDSYSTFFSESVSNIYRTIEKQDGSYRQEAGTTSFSFSYGELSSEGTFSQILETIISDFWPLDFSTYRDNDIISEYSFSNNLEEIFSEESFLRSYAATVPNTIFTTILGSSNAVLFTTGFEQTNFVETTFIETLFSTGALFSQIAHSSSTISNTIIEDISQETGLSSVKPYATYLTRSSYICSSDSPILFWFVPDAAELPYGRSQTNFSLLSDIASSATSFSTESFVFEYAFEIPSTTYSDGTIIKTIGLPSNTFSYLTTTTSSLSVNKRRRDGSLSQTAESSTISSSSSFSKNGTFIYSVVTNENASYYEDYSYATRFDGFYENIVLVNQTTSNVSNFPNTNYEEFKILGLIGIKSGSTSANSILAASASFSVGNYSSSSTAAGETKYTGPQQATSRLYRANGLVSTTFSSPKIFDVSFNGGFCAFSPENTNIYKNLLVSKKIGDGSIFVEDSWASVCPNIRSSLASNNFTSFVKDCWTYSTLSLSETIIKPRSAGFIDSTFKQIDGGTFTTRTDGQLINLGGKETTLQISTNDTLASYFSYRLVEGSYLTQILEFKLTDSIQESEKSSWTTFNTNDSYYQYNTNGKLILYPGAGYFLTINSNNETRTQSYLLSPTAEPQILNFDRGDGFVITMASLFAKGNGASYIFTPYTYSDESD